MRTETSGAEVVIKEETITVDLPITKDQFRDMVKKNPVTAAMYLENEILTFDAQLQRKGMDPLTRYERQILKEYLGFKIMSENT